MATKKLIDANKCPCNTCRTQYCGDPHRCTNFMMWLHHRPEDAVEVVHGKWIDSYIVKRLQHGTYPTVKCSNCGCYFCDVINNHHFMYHYCPNCGAKMDLKGE